MSASGAAPGQLLPIPISRYRIGSHLSESTRTIIVLGKQMAIFASHVNTRLHAKLAGLGRRGGMATHHLRFVSVLIVSDSHPL